MPTASLHMVVVFKLAMVERVQNQMAEMNDSTIFHEHVRMMRCVIIDIHIADKLQKQLKASVS
jgi:hypothetical protein